MSCIGRQRGVAMLTAIILVALATIVAATIAFNNAMAARRATAVLTFDQGIVYAQAAEAMAAYVLREDAGQRDDYTENWAQPYGPLEVVPGVWLEARLEDLQGRFNINSVVDQDGEQDPEGIARFEFLLKSLEIEARWAALFADWVDRDLSPLPDGGEDTLYSAQDPGYRAPNAPVTSVSELLALPGFGADRYTKLAPYLTALPPGTPVNPCTAPGWVLDALIMQGEFGADPEGLAKSRASGCYPTKQDLMANRDPDMTRELQQRVEDKSNYFRLRSFVSIGTQEFALYSLLYRAQAGGQVLPIQRTYGPD